MVNSGGNSNASSQPGPMQKATRMNNFEQFNVPHYQRETSGSPPQHNAGKQGAKGQVAKKKNFMKLGGYQKSQNAGF